MEVYNANGTPKATWDLNPGGGYYTTRVAVNSDGWVYTVNSQSISQTSPHTINVYDRNGTWLFRFGQTGTGTGQTLGYRGIAIGPNQEVYVLDGGNKRIQVFDRNGVYLRAFGTAGSGPGHGWTPWHGHGPHQPVDLRVRRLDGTIEKFSMTGTRSARSPSLAPTRARRRPPRDHGRSRQEPLRHGLHRRASGRAQPTGQQIREIPEVPAPARTAGFNQPEGLAIDQTSGQVYVTDTFNHRIQRFSSTGVYQAKWGYRGRGTGDAMDYPRGIAVDRQDRTVWLNNTRSAQIKHYQPGGAFLGQFGSQGANPDQFYYSRGIHAGTDGRLYVPDSGNRRLQVLTKAGALVWSAPCGAPALTGNYVLFGCTSVDRDPAGNVYAAAPTEDVIYKFSSTGTLLQKIGTHGTGAGQFDGAYGVAIRNNRMYVSEMDNNRITVMSLTGQYLGSFGSAGSGHGQLRRPTAIAFDSPVACT